MVYFPSFCKISGQTDKMPRNERKNKIITVNKNSQITDTITAHETDHKKTSSGLKGLNQVYTFGKRHCHVRTRWIAVLGIHSICFGTMDPAFLIKSDLD